MSASAVASDRARPDVSGRSGGRVAALVFAVSSMALASGAPAWAIDRIAIKTETYRDTDHNTVIRPAVAASADAGPSIELAATYTVDVITAASVDVVTSATSPTFRDRRQEVSGQLTWRGPRGLAITPAYAYSTETDYRSHAVSLSAERRLAGDDLTLAVRAGYLRDTVMSVSDPAFQKSLRGGGAAVDASLVLSPRLVARIGLEGTVLDGYQQSPYRSVRFGDFQADLSGGHAVFDGVTAVRIERHPEKLQRYAGTLGASWLVGARGALQPRYAFHADSWGVRASEIELAHLLEPRRDLILRTRYRLYLQSAADFYQGRYIGAPESFAHYSADKRLGPIEGHLIGERVEVAVAHAGATGGWRRVGADVNVDVVYNRYLDFAFLDHRWALVVQLGMFLEY